MRLTRIAIENFRNLDGLDVEVDGTPVIVGENRAGKSNLIHAIRLVLDPSMSNASRWLSRDDFSAHLGDDPMSSGHVVTVALEFGDFEDEPGVMAALRHGIIAGEPLRARLTYRFGPRELVEGEEALAADAYVWSVLGGNLDDARRVPSELRSFLHLEYLDALRDVEGDLNSWRRSPLRRLLEQAADDADPAQLAVVADALKEAAHAVDGLESVRDLADRIARETERLVGAVHQLEPSLRVGPTDAVQAVRALRLLVDGDAQRALRSASLGSLNVLYLALLQLELTRRLGRNEIGHVVIAIEEPEAHLHPHLQRKAFHELRATDGPTRSTLVTTHSAHIVSVCDPRRLVILRDDGAGRTRAFASVAAGLTDEDWDDIGRYLDVTRSEMVFARKVLLVEGLAEQLLMPGLARGMGMDLDAMGVTVCAVAGVNFEPYVRFLRALGTPYAVATDGDPRGPAARTGEQRMETLAQRLTEGTGEVLDAEALGLFHGTDTLELDLADDNLDAMLKTLAEFEWGPKLGPELATATDEGVIEAERLMVLIEHVSKGRFAQRLAVRAQDFVPPGYVKSALEHLRDV